MIIACIHVYNYKFVIYSYAVGNQLNISLYWQAGEGLCDNKPDRADKANVEGAGRRLCLLPES